MNINGMTSKYDVINSVIDNIDNKELDTAKDSLNHLKDIELEAEALNPEGKYKLVLPSKEPEDSKIDTMLELQNEMQQGK